MGWVAPQTGSTAASGAVGHHRAVRIGAAEARWSESDCPSLISAEASARAFPARRWSRLEAFLLKLRAQQAVHIVALGSSMTLGKECETERMVATNPPCAWPARLEALLSQLFAPATVRVSNLARNGYNTRVWAMENVETIPELRQADMIIHSGAIGDAEFDAAGVRSASLSFFSALLEMAHRPAVVALEVTRAADLRRSGTLRWLRPCREKEGPLP